MNAPNLLAGVAMLVAGIFLFFAGPQLIMVPSTQTQVVNLFSNDAFVVGDISEHSVQLDEDVLVNGTASVVSALTGEASEISMLVFDDANYQKWIAHANPTYLLQKDVSSGQTFSFTAPHIGVYHLVFDNTDSPVKKKVTMTADFQRQVTVNVPYEDVRYLSYALLVVGVVVSTIGVLRKTEIPWA